MGIEPSELKTRYIATCINSVMDSGINIECVKNVSYRSTFSAPTEITWHNNDLDLYVDIYIHLILLYLPLYMYYICCGHACIASS